MLTAIVIRLYLEECLPCLQGAQVVRLWPIMAIRCNMFKSCKGEIHLRETHLTT